jgi:adenylate cyclase
MNKKNLLISLLAALFLSLMQLLLFLSPLGERIEILTLEASFNVRGQVAPPDDIIILSMDESSYRVLDLQMDQAWPRSLHADVLNRLKEYQAKRVVMDILFLGRSSDQLADQKLAQSLALTPTVLAAEDNVVLVAHVTPLSRE